MNEIPEDLLPYVVSEGKVRILFRIPTQEELEATTSTEEIELPAKIDGDYMND